MECLLKSYVILVIQSIILMYCTSCTSEYYVDIPLKTHTYVHSKLQPRGHQLTHWCFVTVCHSGIDLATHHITQGEVYALCSPSRLLLSCLGHPATCRDAMGDQVGVLRVHCTVCTYIRICIHNSCYLLAPEGFLSLLSPYPCL